MSGSRTPLVTVLMPVRNVTRYVGAALESVLEQTWEDLEVLVVDDASTDDTVDEVVRVADERVRLIRLGRCTGDLGATLNAGLAEARGAYVARMDGDDLSKPERLEAQVEALDGNPELGLVGTWADLIDGSGLPIGASEPPTSDVAIRIQLHYRNAFHHGSVMFRNELVSSLGGYGLGKTPAEDYDLWTRLARRARVANLPAVHYVQRMHNASVSALDPEGQAGAADEVANDMLEATLGVRMPADVVRALRAGAGERAVVREATQTLRDLRAAFDAGLSQGDVRERDAFLAGEHLRLGLSARSPGAWSAAARLSPRWVLSQSARELRALAGSRRARG